MADKPVSRPMKYPYTWSAKIAQFPYKHYFKHSKIIQYYCASFFLCMPLFWSIQKAVNSPTNVELWEKKRLAELAEHSH